MASFTDILTQISEGVDLDEHQASYALNEILHGSVAPSQIAAFLFGMNCKGETIEELTGFVKAMRKMAVNVDVNVSNAVDMCGTGGDKSGTFNISTAAMFVVAGAGVPVLKHGNAGVSSKSGSYDVLIQLGAEPDLMKEDVETTFKETGMAFMFAPRFHPAMAHVMPVRKELAMRTFFNIMGPMLNPANVKRQVVGAFNRSTAKTIIQILHRLGSEFVYTLHADDGLDELSTSSLTRVYQLNGSKKEVESTVDAEIFGFARSSKPDLAGGNSEENAVIIRSVLENNSTQAQKEIVLLNAAFAIHASGLCYDIHEALLQAEESLESEEALQALNRFSECTKDLKAQSRH
ncbi:anthranilate phosphoribosyltransferase [Balneolaceae bacterium ANBcel3]|nr:anthranilate phosphoribosyltransferase [Balneolaceae bacterium ANBcel3]